MDGLGWSTMVARGRSWMRINGWVRMVDHGRPWMAIHRWVRMIDHGRPWSPPGLPSIDRLEWPTMVGLEKGIFGDALAKEK